MVGSSVGLVVGFYSHNEVQKRSVRRDIENEVPMTSTINFGMKLTLVGDVVGVEVGESDGADDSEGLRLGSCNVTYKMSVRKEDVKTRGAQTQSNKLKRTEVGMELTEGLSLGAPVGLELTLGLSLGALDG